MSHYQLHIPPTNQDVAALIFSCGIAAQQVYGAAGSGTFGVNQAYTAYLRFNCTTCTLLHATDPDVYNQLSKNMIEALPAHLAIVNEDWTMGHNVVVDGYNTDNFFHINFGWSGTYNGWYLLPDDLPYGLTVLEGVIVDIMENHTGPRLSCAGSLHWTDSTPGSLLHGNFTVKNTGGFSSHLNWTITDYPDWGTWSFTPSQGTNLTPEENSITINISLLVPLKKNRKFSGYIRVINHDDPTDCGIIPITLATPNLYSPLLFKLIQFLSEKFPRISILFNNFIFR